MEVCAYEARELVLQFLRRPETFAEFDERPRKDTLGHTNAVVFDDQLPQTVLLLKADDYPTFVEMIQLAPCSHSIGRVLQQFTQGDGQVTTV